MIIVNLDKALPGVATFRGHASCQPGRALCAFKGDV